MGSGEQTCVPSCAIVIPVHNERAALPVVLMDLRATIETIPQWNLKIICVDDGSDDGTTEWLRRQNDIAVFYHSKRRGYGASLKMAIEHDDAEWICIMDGDASYPASAIPQLLGAIRKDTSMVIGKRTGSGMNETLPRQMARAWLRLLTRMVTGRWVGDLNSGLRVFHRDLYHLSKPLLPDGFSFTSTLTVVSLLKRLGLIEIPIDYRPRIGESHIRPVPDFQKFCWLILRARHQLRRVS